MSIVLSVKSIRYVNCSHYDDMSRFRVFSHLFKLTEPDIVKRTTKPCFFIGLSTVNRNRFFCSLPRTSSNSSAKTVLDPVEDLDLSGYGSVLLPSYNLAAYANKSVVLQELIKLGVELYKLEKKPGVAKFLLQLNYEKNIKPHLLFLHDQGVPTEKLGKFITKNPFIFKEDLNDLNVRINYLKAKKFSSEMISNIITKNPLWLSTPVRVIDQRLGYLQQTFNLKGDDVRKMINQTPSLVNIYKKRIMINTYLLKEEMGLDDFKLKRLVVQMPVLLRKDEYEIMSTFEYLTKIMKIPVDLILKQPIVLTYQKFILKERHTFLEKLGRAQYNPLLPGYVPLTELFQLSDNEFCDKIAKTSVLSYNEYLKTL